MLEKVKRLFGELHGGSKHSGHFDADDYRVAAAALLVHVATLDNDLTGPARQKLGALLMAQFSLTDQLTDELIEAAVSIGRRSISIILPTCSCAPSTNKAGYALSKCYGKWLSQMVPSANSRIT